MQNCPKCGETVNTVNKVCPYCGQSLRSRPSNNKKRATRQNNKTLNNKVRKIIPWGIALFIIILLIIIFFLLKNFNSPEAQADLLINAIDNNDTQKVSSVLSTQNNNVDEDEATAYIKYIKEEVGMKNFAESIHDKISKLNEGDSQVSNYVTARNSEKVLKITKNGTRFFLFNNMNFTAPTKEAIVKPKFDATYKFRSNDKQRTVTADKNQATSLGKFIPGDYSIEAKRETENGQFSGELKFNFNDSNNETVDVNQSFNEAYLRFNLNGADNLDKDTIKVKINDKSFDYDNSKAYGPYPKTKQITVKAVGEAKKKEFSSDETTIQTDNLKDNTTVSINFDEEEIDKYVKKKEKEENSFRNKITNFFSDYTPALNTAYTQNNFDMVSEFVKKGSSNYKATKNGISSNQYRFFQIPQISEIVRLDDKFYVTGYALKRDGQYGEVNYVLEGTSKGDDLQVINYSE